MGENANHITACHEGHIVLEPDSKLLILGSTSERLRLARGVLLDRRRDNILVFLVCVIFIFYVVSLLILVTLAHLDVFVCLLDVSLLIWFGFAIAHLVLAFP